VERGERGDGQWPTTDKHGSRVTDTAARQGKEGEVKVRRRQQAGRLSVNRSRGAPAIGAAAIWSTPSAAAAASAKAAPDSGKAAGCERRRNRRPPQQLEQEGPPTVTQRRRPAGRRANDSVAEAEDLAHTRDRHTPRPKGVQGAGAAYHRDRRWGKGGGGGGGGRRPRLNHVAVRVPPAEMMEQRQSGPRGYSRGPCGSPEVWSAPLRQTASKWRPSQDAL